MLLASAVVPLWLHTRNHRQGAALRAQAAAVNTKVTDTVQGSRELLVFDNRPAAARRIREATYAVAATQRRQGLRTGLEMTATTAVSAFGTLSVLMLGAWLVTEGRLAVTALPVGVVPAGGAFAPVITLLGASRIWGVTNAAADRVFALLAQPAAVSDDGTAPPPASTDVRFEDVHSSYPGGTRQAVAGVDLVVEEGETVALVGASGAGKSTLAGLLVRFAGSGPLEGSRGPKVVRGRIELPTPRFSVVCSTN